MNFDANSPHSFSICLIGTCTCFFIQIAEKLIPLICLGGHILLPPIIPQIITILAGCMTLLAAYPHLKARIRNLLKKHK